MDTLADRLRWILANGVNARGKRWTQRSLSLAAGLSQSHVGLLIRGDLGSQVSMETIAKLAQAAGVDLTWLATGAGTPTRAPGDPVPARAAAAHLAREAGVSELAIAAVMVEDVPLERASMPVLWWANRMQTRALEMIGQREPTPAAVSEIKRTSRRTS
jgi:transcriptional regulator with XRE-family HTH domain